MNEITSLRIKIKEAEIICSKTKYKLEKSIARYLVTRLKDKLVNLMYPQPKEL